VAGGAADLAQGVARATEAVDSGDAREVLERLVARSRELSGAS
jgi:anthranilate phosphoribosyltransferase